MCVGIPVKVLEPDGFFAWCEGRNGRERINLMLTGPQEPGTWVLSFLGSAREVLSEEEAGRINIALDGMDAIMRGEAFDLEKYYPDFVSQADR
jgi:hydrogenase assembly chaperone HypC/HupF